MGTLSKRATAEYGIIIMVYTLILAFDVSDRGQLYLWLQMY